MNTLKIIAFAVGLVIIAFGVLCILDPPAPTWVAQHVVSTLMFCIIGVIRIAIGLVFIYVAKVTRFPKTIRVLGYFVFIAGIATVVMGFVAIDQAHAIVGWWVQYGTHWIRLTGVVVIVFGGFVAYACAPLRRTA